MKVKRRAGPAKTRGGRPARKRPAPRRRAPRASPAHTVVGSRLQLISQVTDRLVRTLDFDETLRTLIEGATDLLAVERGSILILDPETRTLSIRVAKGLDPRVVASTRIPLGEGIAGSVAESGVPLVVQDIRELPLWRETTSASRRHEYEDFSALCVPLAIHGRVQGVMNFNHKRGGRPFDQQDLEFALLIANQASVALFTALLHQQYQKKEALDSELRTAHVIQERLMHQEPPELPGFTFAATCRMCNQVGGDYFDFIELGEGRVAVAIGDVAGHGLGAALLVADARAALRGLLSRGKAIEDCLFELNNQLHQDTGAEMYMTLLLGVVDGPGRFFHYATAGHHMPIVTRRGKSLRLPLMGSNIPLGIRRDIRFLAEQDLKFQPGDAMLLYTDGVWEATDRDGRRFGSDRITAVVESCDGQPTMPVIEMLLDSVARHRVAPEAEDDYTLIFARAVE